MEPRNYEAGAGGSAPAAPVTPSNGYPTDGNPTTATPATKPGAHWFYKIGESLRNVITSAGLTPSDLSLTQLKEAIVLLSNGTNATESAKGSAEIATQAETDAGTDDQRFVTPKKMRWGFSILLATNGYVVFPTWMRSLTINWGKTVSLGSGVSSGIINYGAVYSENNIFTGFIGISPVASGSNTNLALTTETLTSFSFVNAYLSAVVFKWFSIGY